MELKRQYNVNGYKGSCDSKKIIPNQRGRFWFKKKANACSIRLLEARMMQHDRLVGGSLRVLLELIAIWYFREKVFIVKFHY